jgi:hypothetical protein
LFSFKENQETLYDEVKTCFGGTDFAHPAWNTITSIGLVESIRRAGETVTCEQGYYVTSLPADPEVFGTSLGY